MCAQRGMHEGERFPLLEGHRLQQHCSHEDPGRSVLHVLFLNCNMHAEVYRCLHGTTLVDAPRTLAAATPALLSCKSSLERRALLPTMSTRRAGKPTE